MPVFKNENNVTLGASAIFSLASIASLIGGIALLFNKYAATGLALIAFAVFLFSILMLTGSFSHSGNQFKRNESSNTWLIVLVTSLVAVLFFGWLAVTTEFGK